MNRKHYILSVNGVPIYDVNLECMMKRKEESLRNGGKYYIFRESGHFEMLTFHPELDTLTHAYYENIPA
jgi:hypothetical protein